MNMTINVTPKMHKAGLEISELLYDASVMRCLDRPALTAFLEEEPMKNKDLVEDYLGDRIDSVTAIFIAMQRESFTE